MKKLFHLLVALFVFGAVDISDLAVARDMPAPARPVSLPKPPGKLTATTASLFQINLSWSDKSANEAGFKIERATDGKHFTQIAQVLPGTTAYRDTGLFPGSSYFYRVCAFNAAGNSKYSNASRARTPSAQTLALAEWGNTSGAPPGESNWVAVAAGAYHGLALTANGTVVGWKDNDFFYGHDFGQATPPTNLTGVIAVAAGRWHSLALKADGNVVGWGYDGNGQATPPTNLTHVVAIAAGDSHSLALKNDGTVVAWGGLNEIGSELISPPTNLTGVVAIACGGDHSLALKSDGTIVGWGFYYYCDPTAPTNLTQVVAIAAGSTYSLALKSDGTVAGWGCDSFGATVPPTNLTQVIAIAAGESHSLALKKDGTVVGWGFEYTSLVTPPGLGGVVAISAGGAHNLALTMAPAAPSGVQAKVISARQIALSWLDDSTTERGFKIERWQDNGSINPGTWIQIGTVGAGKTNYTDLNAMTNVTYSYRVRAFNLSGNSLYSQPITVTIAPLAAPVYLAANLNATNGVDLSWYDGFAGLDGFKLERAADAGGVPGTWMEIATVNATNDTYYFTDTSVAPHTTYWYRVRAFNVVGASPYTDATAVNIVPPDAPGNFSGNAFADKANLYWYGDAQAAGYKIERAPDSGGSPGAWLEITNIASYSSGYTDAGLAANTTYWYRVRAYNWVGDSDYTVPISVTILPPAAPNSVVAAIGLTNNVDVSWSENPDDQDGFKLERAPDAGGSPGAWTEIASLSIANAYSDSYSDTYVAASSVYWYRVRAFNALGLSDYSAAVSVNLVPPPAPNSLNATPFADRVNLYWNVSATGVMGFKIERAPDASGVPGAWAQIATLDPASYYDYYYGSYTDTNRAADTTYWYRVRAFNWTGDSPYSEPAVVTIVPPSAPAALSAALGNTNQAVLSWQDSAADEDGFTVERASDIGGGPGAWMQLAVINPVDIYHASYTDTNVTANTTNWYRVRAFNVVGVSDYADPVSVSNVPPTEPILSANANGSLANLTWYDPDADLAAITDFQIERAPDAGGNPGKWTQIATVNADNPYNSNNYYTYSGQATGTTNWYRVRAFNWIGSSPYSAAASVTIVPPGTPYSLSGIIGLTNQVNLSWSDYYADEDGFKIERAPDAGGSPEIWTEIASVNATNFYYSYFTDTNVTANTTNWYRVRAFRAADISPYSDPTSVAVVPPPAPYLSAYPFINRVNLSWYVYLAGVTDFKIERAPDAGGNPGTWTEITNTPYTSLTDSNLAANATYWYRARAYNWIGDSPFSDPVSVTIAPPTTPYSVYGTVGTTNQVNLFWYDYSGDEDGFKIESAPDVGGGPGAWTEIGSITASSYDDYFTDTNVTAFTTNWYRVRAFNVVGFSDYTSPASVSIIPPDVPYYLYAYPLKATANMYWNGNYSGAIGGFKIERAPDAGGSPGAWTALATNLGLITSYTDPGLAVNTAYWYRVRAFNWVGDSPASSAASVTIVPPTSPSYLSGNMGTTNQINLSWYDYAEDEDGFKLERAPDAGGSPGTWSEIATLSATNFYSAYFTDTNITANTTNWYRVRAFSVTGFSDYSVAASVSVIPPPLSPSLSGQVTSIHQIDLSWYVNDYNSTIQGYKIERAPDAGGAPGTWRQISAGVYSSYSDHAVTTNQTYWYRVRAFNWVGDSPYSTAIAVVDATPAAPVSLTAVNDGQNQITLAWTDPSTNLTGFKIERALDAGGAPASFIPIASVSSATTSFTDTGLTTGRTYWYRVRAFNTLGNSPYSNEAGAQVRVGQFVRVMQWNIERGLGRVENNYNYQAQAIARIVNFNQPDVLLFCEVDAQNLTPAQNQDALINWVTNNLPYLGTQPGVTFYVAVSSQSDGYIRNAIVSRFPIAGETTFDDGLRGLHSMQVQLANANTLQIFHTHLKCCDDDCARKQTEAQFDAGVIGAFALTNSLPYIFAGDWNEDEQNPECTLSSSYDPIKTMRESGNFVEFKPTNLSGDYRTWSSQATSPSIRFDYILAATNRLSPVSGYVFNSLDWQTHGNYGNFNYYDSFNASDHYCVFANYFFRAPDLVVTPPDTLAGVGFQGGPFAPTNETYTLSNSTTAPLNWTLGKSSGWINLSSNSGTLAAGASTNIMVALNTNANTLADGIYSDAVSFSNATSGTVAATRAVNLTVNDPALLAVIPSAGLASLGIIGGPFIPGQQTYTLSNAGIAALTWTAGATASWLEISATNGTLAAGAITNIVVSISSNAVSLAAANYSDTVTFANTTSGAGNATRDASLAITGFGFYDDFSTFAAGNLVGQKSWGQALASSSLPQNISGGRLVIPFPQSGDNQDAYKNFAVTSATLFYGLTLTISNAPAAASPSYFAALYSGNSASGFADYRLTARDNGGGTYVLGARITGQTGNPLTFGGIGLNYGTQYRVIVEADSGGNVMEVFVNPTSSDPADQTAYLTNYIGGGTPPAQSGSFVFAQFNSSGSPIVGFAVGKIVVVDNFATAYYDLADLSSPQASTVNPASIVEPFQISSILATNDDVLVSWLTIGGTTNAVQAAPTVMGTYTDISPGIPILGNGGTVTNFRDNGALTNTPARFYRIRRVP